MRTAREKVLSLLIERQTPLTYLEIADITGIAYDTVAHAYADLKEWGYATRVKRTRPNRIFTKLKKMPCDLRFNKNGLHKAGKELRSLIEIHNKRNVIE